MAKASASSSASACHRPTREPPWKMNSCLHIVRQGSHRGRASTLCHGENRRSGRDSTRERQTRRRTDSYPDKAGPSLSNFELLHISRGVHRHLGFGLVYPFYVVLHSSILTYPVSIPPLADIQDCDCLRPPPCDGISEHVKSPMPIDWSTSSNAIYW